MAAMRQKRSGHMLGNVPSLPPTETPGFAHKRIELITGVLPFLNAQAILWM